MKMATQVDLRQLAVNREVSSATVARRSRSLTRYGLPLAVIAGFITVVVWSMRESFLPTRPVTVIPVVLTQAEVRQAGTNLFQAAGWVEPRPSAVVVSALVEGVIDKLYVVEGQGVEEGQIIAKLIDADARLALAEAEASVRLREAESALAQSALTAAETGHLVLATLHTSSAASTVSRIVDAFPEGDQITIRAQLAASILGILSQKLIPKASGEGVVAAIEFLSVHAAVQAVIRNGDYHKIPSQIQTGHKFGMRLMDDSIFHLWVEGEISDGDALTSAKDPEGLAKRMVEVNKSSI